MSDEAKKPDIELEFDPKHGTIASYMLWNALCEALADIGRIRGDDGWKEELQSRVHAMFENAEETTTGDQSIFDRTGTSTGPEATETGLKMIDAAFDRIRFS